MTALTATVARATCPHCEQPISLSLDITMTPGERQPNGNLTVHVGVTHESADLIVAAIRAHATQHRSLLGLA